jgi:hypothetical protein
MSTTTTPTMNAAPTYYGRPALKPSLYGWMVALYIFVAGMAGAVQILVTVVDLLGAPESGGIILAGRALALAGAIFGGILLIIELHTRRRFVNMLRIFRPTSPMSIGSYVLMSFGLWSLAALIVELLGVRVLTLIFACLAAVAGWFMTTYTASLLAATSTPLWAAAPRSLAVRFAGSAFASGVAVLCIVAVALGTPLARPFGNFAIIALAVEFIASLAAQRIYRRRGVSGPLHDTPWGPLHRAGVLICGNLLPIALYRADDITSPNPGALAVIASLFVLAGSLLMRGLLFLAGNESASRPLDYFAFAARTDTRHDR